MILGCCLNADMKRCVAQMIGEIYRDPTGAELLNIYNISVSRSPHPSHAMHD